MSKLFLMMGQPGAGKSTYIKKLIGGELMGRKKVCISRDTIRFSMVAEDEPYFSKEKEVFDEFIKQINEALEKGYTVFADATHLNKASRTKVLRKITAKRQETNVIWIRTDLETSLKQNEQRKGTRTYVPQDAIERMYHNIEEPTSEEGINKIFCIENNHIQEVIVLNNIDIPMIYEEV